METIKQILSQIKKKKRKPCYGVSSPEIFRLAIFALNETLANTVICKLPYSYEAYIKSKYWKIRRQLYLERYANTCQKCRKQFAKGMQLHHLSYDRLRNENIDDLVLLCKRCHFIIEAKIYDT